MQEFFRKFFGIDAAPAATITITITIFITGFLLNGFLRLINQYSARSKNRRIFIGNLKSLNESLKKAEDAVKDTISSLDISKSDPWLIYRPEFYQLLIFREMGYKDIFQAYFTGFENFFTFLKSKKSKRERRDSFNKIYANISHIELWASNTFLDFNKFLEKYNEFGDKRNDAINRLRLYWEGLSTNNPADLRDFEIEYLNKLFRIIHNYRSIPTLKRVNPFNTQRNLVLPIRLLNKKSVPDMDMRAFNDIALEASNHYTNMELYLRVFKSQFNIYLESINKVYESNEKIIRVLNGGK